MGAYRRKTCCPVAAVKWYIFVVPPPPPQGGGGGPTKGRVFQGGGGVHAQLDALVETKGQRLSCFMAHHGMDVNSMGQIVGRTACYMLSEKCDLDVACGGFFFMASPTPVNTSPEFEAPIAKFETEDKCMHEFTTQLQAA